MNKKRLAAKKILFLAASRFKNIVSAEKCLF
jgi:hypothetical protein